MNAKSNSTYKLTVFSILFLVLFTVFMPLASASGGYEITFPSGALTDFLENTSLQHSSGKYYHVYYMYDSAHRIVLHGYSSTGQLVLESTITNPFTTATGVTNRLSNERIKIIEHNSTYMIIAISYSVQGTDDYIHAGLSVILFNIDNNNYYITNNYYDDGDMSSGLNMYFSSVECSKYITNYYFVYHYATDYDNAVSRPYFVVYQYNPSTRALTVKTTFQTGTYITSNMGTKINQFINGSTIYLMCSLPNNNALVKYYRIDLVTPEIELLATHPIETYRYSDNKHHLFLGAGIKVNGNYKYLYFTWVYSHILGGDFDAHYNIIQYRMQFNNSIIVGNFLAGEERALSLTVAIDRLYAEVSFISGYMNNASDGIIYYPYGGQVDVAKRAFKISNWFNMEGIYGITLYASELENNDIIYDIATDYIYKNPQSAFETKQAMSNSYWTIYYGFGGLIEIYDLLFSYSPYEAPLIVNKPYILYIQSTLNGVGHKTTIVLYINNVQKLSQVTDESGLLQVNLLVGSSGVYTILAKLYDSNTYKYEEGYSLTFSDAATPSNPTTETILPATNTMIVMFIPIAFIVLLPVALLASMLGAAGMIIGAIIGVVMGKMTGLVPDYFVFLMVIGVALAFVFIMRGGAIGRQEQEEA